MDGLSIATACFAFIEIADKAFKVITEFVRDCKDAQNDLAAVNRELIALKQTLNLLKDLVTNGDENDLTNNTKRDIRDIIQNSLGVATTLEDELRGQGGRLLAVNWATRGKRKVATYKLILETNRRALSLAVETITLATAKNIKKDTTEILGDTTHIRGDISRIISRIQNLETLVTGQETDDSHIFMLKRYLNELSSVAGSVCDPSSRSASPELSLDDMQPQEGSDSNASDDTRSGEDSLTEDAPPSSTDGNVTPQLQLKGPGRSSMESTEDSHVSLTLITPSPSERFSFECHAFQLREAHFLSKNLQIERGTHPLGLSSDGNKLIWLQRGAAPVDIYDIESQRRSKAVVLTGFETLVYWSFKEETKILSTDASLILYKTSKSCWKVRDRLTGNTLRHDFPNSLATWTQQVLPISKDCALVLLGHYRKGYTINRICRASSQGQKSLTWNYKVLPSSRDSDLHHLTLSRDGQNVTGLLGDTRQLLSCTWELSSAWFAEERVTGSRDVKDPIRVSLQHEDMKREVILGLASNSHTVTIVRGSIGVGASSHAGFRNTALRVTTFNLKSGAEISSSFVSASEIHGDHSKYSLFTDAKISADGKLLRTRVAKTPGIGSWLSRGALTDMETVLLRMEGLKVVHRFKEIWNSDYTEPITLSIFAPNFDMLARLTWRKRREDQTLRVWLEVYELKKTLEGAETNLGNQLIT